MLAELLSARVAERASTVAVGVHGGASVTFAEWDRRSDAMARGLSGRAVRRGDRVVLLFDEGRWSDLAVAYAAVHKAGATAVVLSPRWPAPAPAAVVADCGAVGVVAPADLLVSGGAGVAPAWVVAPADLAHGNEEDGVHVDPPGDALAEVLYAAGPLRRMRAVGRSRRDIASARDRTGAGGAARGAMVHAFPVGSAGANDALWFPLVAGGRRAVAVAAFEPDGFCALAAREQATSVGLSPALAAMLLASATPGRHDLSSVEEVVLAGGPSTPPLLAGLARAFPSASVRIGTSLAFTESGSASAGSAVAPVAFSQEGMLWHEQFAPGCQNLPPLARRYRGPLDVEALERALAEIVRRHQPLRTTFELRSGHPVQVVTPPTARSLPVRDLSTLAADEQEAELDGALAEAAQPFDLVIGPLFQAMLYRLGEDDHVLVLRTHHSVYDDWSVGVFRRELSALYTAFLAGGRSPLEELPTTFTDFARAQRRRLGGPEGTRQLAYWTGRLRGAPLALQLPIGDPDRPPGSPQRSAAPVSAELSPELHAGLRALSRRHRATLFMTLLAAFQVLLHRWTGQPDLLLSSVVANRNRRELEGLIGCFSKKVLLRLAAPGDPTFSEVLAGARTVLLEALANQDLAFETVLQEVLGAAAADHGLVPYPVVMFQGVTPEPTEVALPGLATSGFETSASVRRLHFVAGDGDRPAREEVVPWGAGLYSGTFLILSVMDAGDRLSLVARGAFHRPAVEELLASFATLLGDLVAHPERRVSELAVPLPAGVQRGDAGDGVVELRGFRVDLGRIEAALAGSPGVRELALAARDVAGENRLIAYLVPDGDPPALAELRVALWHRLPGYAWPAGMVVVPSLPRDAQGRLDRAALPPPDALPSSHGPPEEAALVAAWSDVLGVERVAPEENYWQSFSFLEAAAGLARAGFPLTPGRVARNRTLRTLAVDLAAGRGEPDCGSDVT